MILLNNQVDITALVEPVTSDSASYSDIFGLIAKKRDYVLRDQFGVYNPFSPGGYFARNPYRAMPIRETDDFGNIIFDGQIYDIKPQDSGAKRSVILSCRDPLGVLLDWRVNMCDVTTYSGWKVSANTTAGANTVALAVVTGTPSDPPANAIISFNDDYSPSFLVSSFNTGTDTVTLDRSLTEALTADTVVNVAVPVLKTPAGAIKGALTAAGIGAHCDGSFDTIDLDDQAAGLYLWFFIQPANKVKLREFIAQVMEIGDIYISVSQTGVISARRGLTYDGATVLRTVTPAEFIAPSTGPYYDTTRLVYAYDVLYASPRTSFTVSGNTVALTGDVKVISNTVDDTTLDDFAAADVWRPVSPSSTDLREYTIAYASENTARYFGNRRLEYFGVGRPRFSASLKRATSGRPDQKFSIALFDEFRLSVPTAQGQTLNDLHAVVVGYSFNFQTRKYDSVEFEITGAAIGAAIGAATTGDFIITDTAEDIITDAGQPLEVW